MKWLRVDIEGCVQGCCQQPVYCGLDREDYSDEELREFAQDIANETHSFGYRMVDESEVPEGEK